MSYQTTTILSMLFYFFISCSYMYASEQSSAIIQSEHIRLMRENPSYQDYHLIQQFLNYTVSIQGSINRESSGRTYLKIAPLRSIIPDYLKNPVREGVFLQINANKINILSRWGVISLYEAINFQDEPDYIFFYKSLFASIDALFVGIEYQNKSEPYSLVEYAIFEDGLEKTIISDLLDDEEIDSTRGSMNRLFALPWQDHNKGSVLYQLIHVGNADSQAILPPSIPVCSREFKSPEESQAEWSELTRIHKRAEKKCS